MHKALDQEGEVEPGLEIVEQKSPKTQNQQEGSGGAVRAGWSLRVVEVPRSAASKLESQASPARVPASLSLLCIRRNRTHHKGVVLQSQFIMACREGKSVCGCRRVW